MTAVLKALFAAAAVALGLGMGFGPMAAAQVVSQRVDLPLEDPVLEARAQTIHKQIRCLVCQNQSIHDSNADLARDLRIVVRERLAAGDADAEAIQYLVARYGDWVLLKPPFKVATLALWLGPALILAFAGTAAVLFLRGARNQAVAAPLSGDELSRVRELLDGGS